MFLRPHHFQASDRYWSESGQLSERWDHPYNYGVARLELSRESIRAFQVQVDVCRARMRDGTLIDLNEGTALDRIDLKDAFSRETEVTVYLAVPKLKVGDQNVAKSGVSSHSRFVEVNRTVQDENQGGNDQELQYRTLNVRLLLSTQDTAGFEVLPLCRVRRAGVNEPVPEISAAYYPPMIGIDAWSPLQLGVREIYDLIAAKIEELGEQLSSREASLSGMDPLDLDLFWKLSALNQAFSTLAVLTFAAGVHPLLAYTELCRIVGQLCFFDVDADRRPPEIPRYDHDDLGTIFRYIKEKIVLYLGKVVPPGYVKRDFTGAGLGMSVNLESSWFGNDWQWYVGVLRQNIDANDCVTLLTGNNLMNWKLGSATQVDDLFRLGMEGLKLVVLPQAPQPLPSRNWLYFQVSRGNAAWQDVLRTQTLAMRLKSAMIDNQNELQGQKRIDVKYKNKKLSLQFALFAVQTAKKT